MEATRITYNITSIENIWKKIRANYAVRIFYSLKRHFFAGICKFSENMSGNKRQQCKSYRCNIQCM